MFQDMQIPVMNIPVRIGERRQRVDITSRIQSDNGASLITAIADQDLDKYDYTIGDYFQSPSTHSLVTQSYSGGTVTSTTVSVKFKYHLADLDTYYGGYNSYEVLNTHHITLLVDTGINRQWNSAVDITNVGYDISAIHTYLKGDILTAIKQDLKALFGGSTGLEHLLNHQLYVTNKYGSCEWHESYIFAPSEIEIYGSWVFAGNDYQKYATNKKLKIFDKYRFNEIYGNAPIWLQTMQSASAACFAYNSGAVTYGSPVSTYRASGLILFN